MTGRSGQGYGDARQRKPTSGIVVNAKQPGALLTAEQARFRDEIRRWLNAEMKRPYLVGLAQRSSTEVFGIEPEFSCRLGAAGYIGITTPVEYGGQGRTRVDDAILQSELAWHRAPLLGHFVAEREVLPALVKFGTDEQRRRLIPGILAGETLVGQCFTEPGAGSDLAAVQTTAKPDGGGFVLDGVKWLNSVCHVASYLWVIAQTDFGARHAGLSMFVVPADLTGVRIEPLAEMTGVRRLNTVYFDEVHLDASCLVGDLNAGWSVAMDSVTRERSGSARPASVRRLIADLTEYFGSRPGIDPPSASIERLVELRIRSDACEALCLEHARDLDANIGNWTVTGNAIKVAGDILEQDVADLATELIGVAGVADIADHAPVGGRAARLHLAAPAFTIGGGTTEILKTVIATRGLGLPRSSSVARAEQAKVEDIPGPARSGSDFRALVAEAAGLVTGRSSLTTADLAMIYELAADAAGSSLAGVINAHVVLPAMLSPHPPVDNELVTVALGDGGEDLDLTRLACMLERRDDVSLVLNGTKRYVPRALDCSRVLVAAQLGREPVLVDIDLAADGVQSVPAATISRARDADIVFRGVRVSIDNVVPLDRFKTEVERAVRMTAFVHAAEGVGIIRELLRHVIAFGKARHAFGHPIGVFQAYQLHCADLAMMLELGGALTRHAALDRSPWDAIRARIYVGRAAVEASRIAIQAHGGRGFLDEHPVSSLYRQAKVAQLRFGAPAWHIRRSAADLLDDRSIIDD
jgi:alkylation response protein AidB-like acyl-CoA dehydrogenase